MDDDEQIPNMGSTGSIYKNFPPSIKVLVVDDDPSCLRIVVAMLKTCQYQAESVREAIEALDLLRQNPNEFDLVMTDVHMPRMDGFELLAIIRREFNIPVALMSADDKTLLMCKGLENGACFYFPKPLRIIDVRNLWQFVFIRKRDGNNIRRINQADSGSHGHDSSSVNEDNCKDHGSKNKKVQETTTTKKTRVVWTSQLHDQFLDAIHILGDRAVPKRILEQMNVSGLSRENVASHLQKYRIFVKRYQDGNQPALPRNPRNWENEPLIPALTQAHPPFTYNLPPGNPPLPVQHQRPWVPFQQGLGGYNSSSSTLPAVPQYYDQGTSDSNVFGQVRYEQPFSVNSPANIQQVWLGQTSSLHEQNLGNYPILQQHGINIGGNSISSRDSMHNVVHQQSQVRQGQLGSGLVDPNFSTFNLHDHSTFNLHDQTSMPMVGLGDMGISNNGLNGTYQTMGVNATSDNYIGGVVGAGHVSGDSLYSSGFNQNRREDIYRGKRPIGMLEECSEFNTINNGYTTQGGGCSDPCANANELHAIIPTHPQPQEQHGDVDGGSWIDYLREGDVVNCEPFDRTFNQADLNNFLFNDNYLSDQQSGEGIMDLDFDFSEFQGDYDNDEPAV